ncbi:MAG: thioredoxin domain-containing protein [Halopseudomonas sp.]
MNKKFLIPAVGIFLVCLFAIAAYVDQSRSGAGGSEAVEQASSLKRYYSPTTGDVDAKVTIVEFFDPACETCKSFHPFVKKLMAANPGKINLVMRYAPFHQRSDYVVKILEAAKLQDKYWETLEEVYAAQPLWAQHGNPQPEKLWEVLGYTGLDLDRAKKDMQSLSIAKHIQQDLDDAQQLGVTKTPGFFVNGKPLVNFGYKQLQRLVESEVNSKYPG